MYAGTGVRRTEKQNKTQSFLVGFEQIATAAVNLTEFLTIIDLLVNFQFRGS